MTSGNFTGHKGLQFAYDPTGTTNLAIAVKNQRSKSNIAPTRAQRENIRQKVVSRQMRVDRLQRVKLHNLQYKMGKKKASNPA